MYVYVMNALHEDSLCSETSAFAVVCLARKAGLRAKGQKRRQPLCSTDPVALMPLKAEALTKVLVGEPGKSLDHLQQLCSTPLQQVLPIVNTLYHAALCNCSEKQTQCLAGHSLETFISPCTLTPGS